ncbi:hypothetical protein [Streptomyces albus]|uniref:hypothetical protein n=1 Tax=Streptomyces albus TaxID=1888 RepID=UPI00069082C8|nr:hypothetical protein [Streptomyces albus]
MQTRRKAAGIVAAVGLAAGTLLAAAPAQASEDARAAGSAERAGAARVQTAPPAPVGARADAGAMASSPQVSPSAERIRYVSSGNDYTCSYGRLCTRVWDPVAGKWKVFDLYVCRTYSLSYWNGYGGYVNNQTTGTKAYFYNSSGGVIKTSTALNTSTSYNWTPVWKIKNC